MKCPICEKEIKNYQTDYMGHVICEEYAKCEDEHHRYRYQFAYGATDEMIGRISFHSYHSDTKEERELQNKQFRAVLELEKEYYKSKTSMEESIDNEI